MNEKHFIINKYTLKDIPFQFGFADYLNGCAGLLQAKKLYNLKNLEIIADYSDHPISLFLKNNSTKLSYKKSDSIQFLSNRLSSINSNIYHNNNFLMLLQNNSWRKLFFNNSNIIQMVTNQSLLDEIHLDIALKLKDIITPRKEFKDYIDSIKTNNNLTNYNILHIRLGDLSFYKSKSLEWEAFKTNFINELCNNFLINYDFITPILLISDNKDLKTKIHEIFSKVITINTIPVHLGHQKQIDEAFIQSIKDTLLDFFLISSATKIYSFSWREYSKFVKIASQIFNINKEEILKDFKSSIFDEKYNYKNMREFIL